MEHSIDIWPAFFKTGGMLLFVIAFLLLLLYLLKRFSNLKIIKSHQGHHINVLAVHHFSPREKAVLMEVMGKTLLIGVTSQNIQTLAVIDPNESIKSDAFNSDKPDILDSEPNYKIYSQAVDQKKSDKEIENGI
ncbi:MAG: flagellar biosynthetic protein FliO [Desulfamplus sp.]|nr:flagellar biosynthetic protein FliO [Desulfamplus sp.]